MRILILTQYYPPEPLTFCHQFATQAKQLGHEVSVITSVPSFPTGKVYNGYKLRLVQEEQIDGIPVTRLIQYPDHSNSALRRTANYASFMLSALTLGNLRYKKADVVFVYQSAILTGLAGVVLARMHRAPAVFFVADLWPESVVSSSMLHSRTGMRLLTWLCKHVYRSADYSFCATKGFARRLRMLGVKEDRLDVMYYWPLDVGNKREADVSVDEIIPHDGKFRVMFAGSMGPSQGLDTVIESAMLLKEYENLEITMVGDGIDYQRLREKVELLGLKNIRFTGRLSPGIMKAVLKRADVFLVHLKTDVLSSVSIPSKTMAYMRSGRPVIMAVNGEASAFVKEHGFGISANPSDPASLSKVIKYMMDLSAEERNRMAQRGVSAFDSLCSSSIGTQKLCATMEKLVGDKKR